MPEPGGEIAEGAGRVVMQKVGPLPVVVWVAIFAGGIGLLIAYRSKAAAGSQTATNSLNANSNASLAGPGAAASFASVEDLQAAQRDIVDQLTQGQADLGTSISQGVGQLQSGITGLQSGQASISQSLGDLGVSLSSFSTATQQQYANLLQAIQNGTATTSQVQAAVDQLNQEVTAGQASGTQAYSAIQAALQSLGQSQANLAAQGSASSAQLFQQQSQILTTLQGALSGAKNAVGSLGADAGNIIFSRADNTRYLVNPNGSLTELTYAQEMAARSTGAAVSYVDQSLAQYKVSGHGDRG